MDFGFFPLTLLFSSRPAWSLTGCSWGGDDGQTSDGNNSAGQLRRQLAHGNGSSGRPTSSPPIQVVGRSVMNQMPGQQ